MTLGDLALIDRLTIQVKDENGHWTGEFLFRDELVVQLGIPYLPESEKPYKRTGLTLTRVLSRHGVCYVFSLDLKRTFVP